MRWWIAFWLLWSVPSALAFAERRDCPIRGMVYGAAEVQEVDAAVAIPDLCDIHFARFERRLVFASPKWRVEVEIPVEQKGWTRFYYLWGQSTAYFGTKAVPVLAGPQEQG